MAYNATVTQTYPGGGVGTFVAEVREIGGRLQMLRANSVQCTGFEGQTGRLREQVEGIGQAGDEVAIYDLYIRQKYNDCTFQICLDDCAGYRAKISGTALPPAYKI